MSGEHATQKQQADVDAGKAQVAGEAASALEGLTKNLQGLLNKVGGARRRFRKKSRKSRKSRRRRKSRRGRKSRKRRRTRRRRRRR